MHQTTTSRCRAFWYSCLTSCSKVSTKTRTAQFTNHEHKSKHNLYHITGPRSINHGHTKNTILRTKRTTLFNPRRLRTTNAVTFYDTDVHTRNKLDRNYDQSRPQHTDFDAERRSTIDPHPCLIAGPGSQVAVANKTRRLSKTSDWHSSCSSEIGRFKL